MRASSSRASTCLSLHGCLSCAKKQASGKEEGLSTGHEDEVERRLCAETHRRLLDGCLHFSSVLDPWRDHVLRLGLSVPVSARKHDGIVPDNHPTSLSKTKRRRRRKNSEAGRREGRGIRVSNTRLFCYFFISSVFIGAFSSVCSSLPGSPFLETDTPASVEGACVDGCVCVFACACVAQSARTRRASEQGLTLH